MHYLTYVMISSTDDIEGDVAVALSPFDEDLQVEPYKRYLQTWDIEAMAQHYGRRPDETQELAFQMERWNGEPGGVDTQGLFSVSHVNPDGKWDWYEVGGRWDGHLPGNGVAANKLPKSLPKKLLPHALLTPDGRWLDRETLHIEGWSKFRLERKTDRAWRSEVSEVFRRYPDQLVIVVDCHC